MRNMPKLKIKEKEAIVGHKQTSHFIFSLLVCEAAGGSDLAWTVPAAKYYLRNKIFGFRE